MPPAVQDPDQLHISKEMLEANIAGEMLRDGEPLDDPRVEVVQSETNRRLLTDSCSPPDSPPFEIDQRPV